MFCETVLAEEAEHLQVRVRPRLEAAEGLQEEVVAEDDRAVRLLGVVQARLDQLGAEAGEPLDVLEDDGPVAAGPLRLAGPDQADELARGRGLRQTLERLTGDQLVDLMCPLREDDLDQSQGQTGQLHLVDDACPGDLAPLGRVPALVGDVLDQLVLGQLGQLDHETTFLSRNQNQPRGASVSRYGHSPIGGNCVRPSISSGT